MKLLREAFIEAPGNDELQTFLYQLKKRFSTYYVVTFKESSYSSGEFRYFETESEAKNYYDMLKTQLEKNKSIYDGAYISWSKIEINKDEDEQEYAYIEEEE